MNARCRLMTLVMALALFLVAGGHWAMLQSVAWATMVKDFSKTGSLTEAVGKTFDGKHPCAMCKKLTNARASEEKARDAEGRQESRGLCRLGPIRGADASCPPDRLRACPFCCDAGALFCSARSGTHCGLSCNKRLLAAVGSLR